MSDRSAASRRSPVVIAWSLALVLVCSLASRSSGQTLAGDCNGDARVGVDELVAALGIALGLQATNRCPGLDADSDGRVSIEELVLAVNAALSSPVAFSGVCRTPGDPAVDPNGLRMCDEGTEVSVYRCPPEERSRCLMEPDALVGSGAIEADGTFDVDIGRGDAAGAVLVFEAVIDSEIRYRTMSFGRLSSGVGGGAQSSDIELGPVSEGAVRLIEENGLETLDDMKAVELLEAVAGANDGTNFGELTPAQAIETARTTGGGDPAVISLIGLQHDIPVFADILVLGDIDAYRLILDETTPVIIQANSRFLGPVFAPCVEVRRRGATVPIEGGSTCTDFTARVDLELEAGEYVVLVSENGNNDPGSYNLLFLAAVPELATPLTAGEPQTNDIEFLGGLDLFTFALDAAETVRLQATVANPGSRADPCIEVRRAGSISPPEGGSMCDEDSTPVNLQLDAGVYTVLLHEWNDDEAGPFNVLLLRFGF
jgi:hypothetical protein